MLVAPRAVSAWPSKPGLILRSSATAASGNSASGSLAFPRLARVLKPAQYQQVLRRGRRVGRGEWFQLLYAAETTNAAVSPAESPLAQARLGLIVGKRNAPLAVSRNAVKRVWRETFRHHRAQLPAGDYVVRLQARLPDLSLTQLKVRTAAEAGRMLAQATEQIRRGASPSARSRRVRPDQSRPAAKATDSGSADSA